VLVSLHNVFFYQKLLSDCRRAIRQGVFEEFKEETSRRLGESEQMDESEEDSLSSFDDS
jgi:tRNA-guanine family transglycosylase